MLAHPLTRVHLSVPAILLVALFVAGCEQPPAPPAAAPPPVTVTTPVQKTITDSIEAMGTLEATERVEIQARVRGFLKSMHFTEGADVNKGDLLFEIDPREFVAERDRKRADLDAARAQLANARSDLERVTEAAKTNAVSQREVTLKTAQRDSAKAAVAAQAAALESAELELSYTKITSPIAGRVDRRLVSIGNLVGSGENTLLTTVVTMDPMYFYFEIPEKLVLEMLSGRPKEHRRKPIRSCFLSLPHEKGFPHKGKLDFMENTADTSTGTIRIRAIFSNESNLLFPGAFGRVRVPRDKIDGALLVQERAVGTDLGGKFLLVVVPEKDNKTNVVERRGVELGGLHDGLRHVKSGLAPGERYIVKGLLRARAGMSVQPTEEAPAKPRGEQPTEPKSAAPANADANQ